MTEPSTPRYGLDEITVNIVDVAAHARALYGEKSAAYIAGRPLPEHDYRIEIVAGNEEQHTRVTFHRGARLSAEDIIAAVNDREPPQ